jgi:hypothetical protein
MRCQLALLFICFTGLGCGHAAVSVVGTWEAYLGSGAGSKLYFGRPEPTELIFNDDGTYSLHLKWGDRSLAQTSGSYRIENGRIFLSPSEDLDTETWPGKAECILSPNQRSFVMRLPKSALIPEVSFYKLRTF